MQVWWLLLLHSICLKVRFLYIIVRRSMTVSVLNINNNIINNYNNDNNYNYNDNNDDNDNDNCNDKV